MQKISILYHSPTTSTKKKGQLIIDDDGQYYFEFKYGGFINTALGLEVFYATCETTQDKYTLVTCNCVRVKDLTYLYKVTEVYKGAYLANVKEVNCVSARAELSGFQDWVGSHLAMQCRADFDLTITKALTNQQVFAIDAALSLRIDERYYWALGEDNVWRIKEECSFSIVAIAPISRMELMSLIFAFQKLLSIFFDEFPAMKSLEFSLEDGTVVQCLKARRLVADIAKEEVAGTPIKWTPWPRLKLTEMHQAFKKLMESFYAERSKYEKIIDLVNDSTRGASELSFLQLTAALESFHRIFFEPTKAEPDPHHYHDLGISAPKNGKKGKWILVQRIYDLMLFADSVEYFGKRSNIFKSISAILRDSRNHYVHRNTPSGIVLSPYELIGINNSLRQLLKAVLLKNLQLGDRAIHKLLSHEYAISVHFYDRNPYSMEYLGNS